MINIFMFFCFVFLISAKAQTTTQVSLWDSWSANLYCGVNDILNINGNVCTNSSYVINKNYSSQDFKLNDYSLEILSLQSKINSLNFEFSNLLNKNVIQSNSNSPTNIINDNIGKEIEV